MLYTLKYNNDNQIYEQLRQKINNRELFFICLFAYILKFDYSYDFPNHKTHSDIYLLKWFRRVREVKSVVQL